VYTQYNILHTMEHLLPFPELVHVEETIPIVWWKFKLRLYGKHAFIEVSQKSFYLCMSVI